MPKKAGAKVLPDIKEATSEYTVNAGYRAGKSDNPPQLDERPIPVAAEGCLDGLAFVITGTLPSLTRDDAKKLIEKYGGRVSTSVSGRTDFLLRGINEVGPKKVEEAKKKNIRIIDEESFFDYLQSTNPDWKPPPPPVKKVENEIELPSTNFPISSLLTEKYRPRKLSDIVGNKSNINLLIKFFDEFKEKGEKKSAILSGPPGIGKSTCAALVALSKGYNPIEFNASDTRSKKSIGEDLSDVFTNTSISGKSNKVCLIFDEIDGMSSGDRGGLQAFVKLVDKTSIPVISICNDRNNRKLDTLAKRSIDIQFNKPDARDICARLQFIAKEEKIETTEQQLLDIARSSKGDIRHAINTLQFWTQITTKNPDGENMSPSDKDGKVIPLNDVIDATQGALLATSSIDERFEDYFVDYGVMPLYIYENLPAVEGHRNDYFEAVDSISLGDNVQNLIRDSNNWSLMNTDALFSTVIPGYNSRAKGFAVSVRIPQWFNKTKKGSRLQRNCVEISSRMVNNNSYVSPNDIYESTAPLITEILTNIASNNKTGTDEFVKFLGSLSLTLDDYENLYEIVMLGGDSKHPRKIPIKPKFKTAITQLYHTKHTDNQKKAKNLSDVKADYFISKMAKGRNPKNKKENVDDNDDDDSLSDLNEEEDEEFVPKTSKEKKTAKKEKISKSQPKSKQKEKEKQTKRKTKAKQKNSSDDDDDDDDLKDFIVNDDEEDDRPKRKYF